MLWLLASLPVSYRAAPVFGFDMEFYRAIGRLRSSESSQIKRIDQVDINNI